MAPKAFLQIRYKYLEPGVAFFARIVGVGSFTGDLLVAQQT
jgi:hypothetical protein